MAFAGFRLKQLIKGLAVAALAIGGAAMLTVDTADARTGRGGSVGSRGSKTFDSAPTTNTAPKAAQPVQRSATQAGATSTAAGAAKSGGFLSSIGGMRGLLLGGLIGAGLASLFGLGGGLAAMLGMILQVALIAGIIYLVVAFIRSRRAQQNGPVPAEAGVSQRQTLSPQQPYSTPPAGGFGGGGGTTPLNLNEGDFHAFEKMLSEIQSAYSREDEPAMRALTTPEMLQYLGEEVNDNMDKGVRNEVTDVKLLQGDLSEAWTEGDSDYATVAMRYSLIDVTVDRKTGAVVSGSRTQAEEATELWTFVRPRGASVNAWKLSAIQQT